MQDIVFTLMVKKVSKSDHQDQAYLVILSDNYMSQWRDPQKERDQQWAVLLREMGFIFCLFLPGFQVTIYKFLTMRCLKKLFSVFYFPLWIL